jgi:hypothetical protein
MTFFRSSSAAVSSERNPEQNILRSNDIAAVRSERGTDERSNHSGAWAGGAPSRELELDSMLCRNPLTSEGAVLDLSFV